MDDTFLHFNFSHNLFTSESYYKAASRSPSFSVMRCSVSSNVSRLGTVWNMELRLPTILYAVSVFTKVLQFADSGR